MATVTPQGITPTTLPQYVGRLQAVFRTAFGPDLDLAPETPPGQLVGLLAELLVEQDEALVAVANGPSLSRAMGSQLDDLGSLLGVARRAQTHSNVAVTLTGAGGTVVREGARARTVGGDDFALTAAVAIGADGTATGIMRAVETGPIAVPAGELTQIVDLIVGWTGVTNPADATPGRDVETDVAYRARYRREVARNSRGGLESIRSSVWAVPGVADVVVRENATDAPVVDRGKTIAPHAICVVVDGTAAPQAIADAIYHAKPPGVDTAGDSTANVITAAGEIPIRYSSVAAVPLSITVDTLLLSHFPADGIAQIKTRVADWFAGRWQSGRDDFDTSGVGIGESLDAIRLLSPIQSVPGHEVNWIKATRQSDESEGGETLLTERLTVAATDVDINILQGRTALTLDTTIASDNIINIAEKAAGFSISGTASDVAEVVLTIGTVELAATADNVGDWSVAVPANADYIAGDNVTLRATARKTDFAYAYSITRAVAVDLAAPSVTYTAPTALTVSTAITPMDPTTTDTDITDYAVKTGSPLPAGLSLDAATGRITGTPTTAGVAATSVIQVSDQAGNVVDVSIAFPAVAA